MKIKNLKWIQQHCLNKNKTYYGTGFSIKYAKNCEYITSDLEEIKNNNIKLCNKSTKKHSSYCVYHHNICLH